MLLLYLIAASAFAQVPEQARLSFAGQEHRYLHSGGTGSAVLLVLPSDPANALAEFKGWNDLAAEHKWLLVMPQSSVIGDPGVALLGALVDAVRERFSVPSSPVYLASAGAMAGMIFYAVSRAPHLWTAALAIGGSPKPALDSDRVFAANTALVPTAWAVTPEEKAANSTHYQKMITAGFNLTVLDTTPIPQAIQFLAKAQHDPLPRKIDCETGNPRLARCYWIVSTEFDASLRNDALRTTRIAPDAQASLDLGAFGYQLTRPGPGVVVEYLPPDYKGPLQLNDRILALSDTPIADAKHYVDLMTRVTAEKPVAVTIERLEKTKDRGKDRMAKDRIRLVSRYQLRKREEVLTARVQGEYVADTHEIVIVSRTVASLKILVPAAWTPASINWNGNPVAQPQGPGCLLLSLKNPGSAQPCTFP